MRVKSLTPPLPSVLPITATTSSAPNTPALMHAAMPEASITLFNSTLVTTMAMGSRSLERVSMLKTGHDVNGAPHRPHPEEPCAARRLEGWPPARPRLLPSFETPTFGRLLRTRLIGLFGWSREPESAQQY